MFNKNYLSKNLVTLLILFFSIIPLFLLVTTSRAEDSVVLVNSTSDNYTDFEHYIQPYLNNFGVPFTLHDIATSPVDTNISSYNLIIIGHRQLDSDNLYLDTTEQSNISLAVTSGTGLVNFDNDLSADSTTPRYQFIDDIFAFSYMLPSSGSGVNFTSEGYTGIRINCWEDDHQEPILTTTEIPADIVEDDGEWTEFLYTSSRPYPTILAGADEENYGLPVMRFYTSGIPNGQYEVIANLYTSSTGRDMRYYYGYTPGDPKANYVDTVGGAGGSDQHDEYSLGTINITDGTFNIYVQDADLTGTGTYPFFGWAWINLVPAQETLINCWEDDHQDPILTTTEIPADIVEDDGEWTEFLYTSSRPYPTILAGADEEDFGLPLLHFFASGIPDGEYEVQANLYTSGPGRDMRYYYGYTPGDPKANYVDTVGGAGGSDQHDEYSLGIINITDGTFDIYVQDADLLGGTYPYFGWAWIRLVETSSTPPSVMHYITERHEPGDVISTGAMTLAGITAPANVSNLAMTGSQPFLSVTTSGSGNAVQFGTYNWMSHSVKGPVYGLDDLVWRSIVWAARKPFVMQGLPPFVTMRVDDESGPFGWIDIANDFGIKPWAGLFFHNVDSAEAAHLSSLVNAGQATATIHAFNGGFFYFNHSGSDWPDATIESYYAEGTQWFSDNNIPFSKFVLPHYYEIGTNAFQGLSDWGVEFIGTFMDPGNGYDSGVPWIANGPYRLYETGSTRYSGPAYYADFITVPGHPEFDGQFFNCVTEIRDDAGYEWYPSNDVATTIGRGVRQTKRALDSMVLPTLFTHGQHVIGITEANWRTILEGITTELAPYNPMYVTMDYACQYIRAMYTSDILDTTYDPVSRELSATLVGETDMPTMFYLFTEVGETIQKVLIDVPVFSGSTDVVYQPAGPLHHIIVTPASPTVATNGTQQFTAQGYDIDGIPLPNLPFNWNVVSGGGAINNTGLFTAGMIPGIYTDTVVASYNGIEGYASVDLIEPTLDHFTFDFIYSPQYIDIPFTINIIARDISGNQLMSYNGQVNLNDSTGTITPAISGNFSNGMWAGEINIGQISSDIILTASDGSATGLSNIFYVENLPGYYEVTSASYTQNSGVPFQVTVTAQDIRINCWEDDHQTPVLYTFYDSTQFVPDDNLWDEFKYAQRDYPGVFASQTESPEIIKFHSAVPNGTYRVVANLYRSNDFRYYYGFDPSTPRGLSVDVTTGPIGDFAEFDLGTITITDNLFELYTDYAEVINDNGTFPYYGWAWIRLVPAQAEYQINCWEDNHQDPILTTTQNVPDLVDNDGVWTEFLYPPIRNYPSILAGVDEDTASPNPLPVMRFYSSGISNGEYEVIANLYTSSVGRDMRYYFGYTSSAPKEFYVDTIGGAGGSDQHEEYSLGTTNITDGTFNIFVQDADLTGTGYNFFGWAWIRLIPVSSDEQINCGEDDQQDPALVTTTNPADLGETDGEWTEFLYTSSRPYPSILAGVDEELYGLPVMRFYTSGISNGEYEVIANLYTSGPGRDMRYYYGYTPGDPKDSYIDTIGGTGGTEQHTEYSLGTVIITDETFDIYVQDADLTGTGYPFFGWAWVRLVPTDLTMITMTSSSPTMVFDGDEDGTFGEPGDDLKPLIGNTMSIMALDLLDGTDVDIIATDDLGQTGSNSYTILPFSTDPLLVSFTPTDYTSPLGIPVDFTLTLADGDGFENIKEVRLVIKEGVGTGTSSDAIVLWYTSLKPDRIYLWNPTESRWFWAVMGSSTLLENNHCTLNASLTNITGNGSLLTINYNITPKSAFVEAPLINEKRIWLRAKDIDSNLLGDIEVGAWLLTQACTDDVDCNDAIYCNGDETCTDGACQPGADPCPGTLCDEGTDTCVDCLSGFDCDDGLFCNGIETCSGGTCQTADDPCPDTLCDEAMGACVDCLSGFDCDDGLFCNGTETCSGGTCQSGDDPCVAPLVCDETTETCLGCIIDSDCDDGISCTQDTCEPDGSCLITPDDLFCDDDLFCNGDEACDVLTGCVSGLAPCSDQLCNEDSDQCEGSLPSEPILISFSPEVEMSEINIPLDFTLEIADGDGYEDVKEVRVVFKEGVGTGTSPDAIVLWYTSSKPDRIYLWNNTEGRWNWALMGSSTFLENDLCILDAALTSVTGAGTSLTINYNITPKSSFIEDPLINDKRIWLRAKDTDNNVLGNIEIGSWTITE